MNSQTLNTSPNKTNVFQGIENIQKDRFFENKFDEEKNTIVRLVSKSKKIKIRIIRLQILKMFLLKITGKLGYI